MILFALATFTSVEGNVSSTVFSSSNCEIKFQDMGSDGNGWTLNSIGYNRGFTDVLKKLMDYKVRTEDNLLTAIISFFVSDESF